MICVSSLSLLEVPQTGSKKGRMISLSGINTTEVAQGPSFWGVMVFLTQDKQCQGQTGVG